MARVCQGVADIREYLPPASATGCVKVSLPPKLAPGRYRIVKRVMHVTGSVGRGNMVKLFAAFRVVDSN